MKDRPSAAGHEDVSASTGPSVKLSVNVSDDIGQRLRRIAFEERLSESSIVEIALDQLFDRTTAANVGSFLRERGASLRRGVKER